MKEVEILAQLARRWYPRQGGLSLRFQTAGRILLWFTGILLAVMPLTEHFGRFDNFQQGGPDFELSLLALLSLFCLVLLLAHGGKCMLFAWLALRHLVSMALRITCGTAWFTVYKGASDESFSRDEPAKSAAFCPPLLI